MNNKYLLFNSTAGFNDILVQLDRCIKWCEQNSRTLLFDFEQTTYKVPFGNYFNTDKFIHDKDKIREIVFNCSSVHPDGVDLDMILSNQDGYLYGPPYAFRRKSNYTCLALRGTEIVFDLPDRDDSDLIINVAYGGGYGFQGLKHFNINRDILAECESRRERIPGRYLFVHMRGTDKSKQIGDRYDGPEQFLELNKQLFERYKHVYFATDDKNYINLLREKGLSVYNFTTLPDTVERNLHRSGDISPDQKMVDLLCDMYMASRSEKVITNMDKFMTSKIGAFSGLLRSCREHRGEFDLLFKNK